MRISTVVCTYKRPDILHRSLKSLATQTLSSSNYEVIVVFDKNDVETAAVIDEHATDIPNLELCHDEGRGLSYARNIGFNAAEGEYVAFLDDDANAEPEWLETLLHTFETVSPTPNCVGGPVRPDFETEVPWWMPSSLPGLPVCMFGDEARWLSFPDEQIIGANMAYPRQFLIDTGGFQTDLGRKDGTLLSNEEVVLQAAAAAGAGIYYQPDAGVDHFIGSHRLTLRYLVSRHYWQGISDCRVDPSTATEATDKQRGRSLREGVPRAIRVLGSKLFSGNVSSCVMVGLWTAYIVGYLRERLMNIIR
ncbi:glycosyltransferase family 2 protein [Halorubrum sp. SD626R]|uniref:glycosyltransferase family 2 protein n=1 Tax=Halorubrum sp. SD626R TaxID=1419722 RepID=UPI0010F7BFDE|nr:glycosyltransferase family 2 protein [Halorubrum sp. SD626R]TKX79399.1 glycosyltransferase family 2 protein [Halorubrum sp. SD626R]